MYLTCVYHDCVPLLPGAHSCFFSFTVSHAGRSKARLFVRSLDSQVQLTAQAKLDFPPVADHIALASNKVPGVLLHHLRQLHDSVPPATFHRQRHHRHRRHRCRQATRPYRTWQDRKVPRNKKPTSICSSIFEAAGDADVPQPGRDRVALAGQQRPDTPPHTGHRNHHQTGHGPAWRSGRAPATLRPAVSCWLSTTSSRAAQTSSVWPRAIASSYSRGAHSLLSASRDTRETRRCWPRRIARGPDCEGEWLG